MGFSGISGGGSRAPQRSKISLDFGLLAALLVVLSVAAAAVVLQQINARDLSRLQKSGDLQLHQSYNLISMLKQRYNAWLAAFALDPNTTKLMARSANDADVWLPTLERMLRANPVIKQVLLLDARGHQVNGMQRGPNQAPVPSATLQQNITTLAGFETLTTLGPRDLWYSDVLVMPELAGSSPLLFGAVPISANDGARMGYLLIGIDLPGYLQGFQPREAGELQRVDLLDAQLKPLAASAREGLAALYELYPALATTLAQAHQTLGTGQDGLGQSWQTLSWLGKQANGYTVMRSPQLTLLAWLPAGDTQRLLRQNALTVALVWAVLLCILMMALALAYRRSRELDRLSERERRVRQINKTGYWRLNLDNRHLELSAVMTKSLDVHGQPGELWQQWLARLGSDHERGMLDSAIEQLLRTGQNFQLELTMHNPRINYHAWGLVRGALYTDEKGQRWVEGTVTDVTARKNAELEAEQFRNNLRSIVDWARLGVWEFDLAHGVRRINRYVRDMLGLDLPMTGEFIDFDWAAHAHPDDLGPAAQARNDYLAGKTTHYSARLRVRHRLGHWVSFMLEGEHVAYDAQGQATLMRGTAMDVTELIEAREKAEAASQAKTQFLSRMSHELRSPLNSITGYGQFLRLDDRLHADQKEHIEAMLVGARHLLNLINDLLQITQDDTASVQPLLQSVSLNQLTERCVVLMRPLIDERKQLVHNQLPDQTWVQADALRLQQVVINLLANAVKYSPEGATITLSATPTPGWVQLSVRDQGGGIAPHIGEQVFEPFFRQQHHASSEGAGLGLAVTRRLVMQMQGRIHFESTPGVGTVFHVALPQARPVTLPEASPRIANQHPWHRAHAA